MRKALDGSDAVISTLPGGNRRDPHLTADITAAIITAMADVDVRRLVVTNAYPIVADRPRPAVTLLRC
ncbi:NAD(P)H-binding [Nonomuraea jiangxiensis]|uniref:NAD(P)H-binding n=1 Tax=Nonomuraea jiangxiensis TaxID=633440 RepID=A0A1G9JR76_9ACTN|nr:NAD(P)H-binding [Nonomuraea jiangxiensis]